MDPYDGSVLGKPFDPKFEPSRRSLGADPSLRRAAEPGGDVTDQGAGKQRLLHVSPGACLPDLPAQGRQGLRRSGPGERTVLASSGSTRGQTGRSKAAPVEGGGKPTIKSPFEAGDAVLLLEVIR